MYSDRVEVPQIEGRGEAWLVTNAFLPYQFPYTDLHRLCSLRPLRPCDFAFKVTWATRDSPDIDNSNPS